MSEEVNCSMCMQNFDFMASSVTIESATWNKICTEGQLSPVMEKKGILGDSTNQDGDLVTSRFPIGNKAVVWQLMWR